MDINSYSPKYHDGEIVEREDAPPIFVLKPFFPIPDGYSPRLPYADA